MLAPIGAMEFSQERNVLHGEALTNYFVKQELPANIMIRPLTIDNRLTGSVNKLDANRGIRACVLSCPLGNCLLPSVRTHIENILNTDYGRMPHAFASNRS